MSAGWQRYIALGDSMTEGLWDPYPPEHAGSAAPDAPSRPSAVGQTGASAATDAQLGGAEPYGTDADNLEPGGADSYRTGARPGGSLAESVGPAGAEPALCGWADRLAMALSAGQIADGGAHLEYANLAVRGRLLGPILDAQLPRALELGADLVSIVGGGNDLLRPNADPDRLAARLERAVRTAREAGADVLLATGTDTRRAPLLAAIRPKVAVYNTHIWSIARRTGAFVLDVWGIRALQDWRMWASDRIHLSSEGHHRVAQAALVALGLPPEDPLWMRPLPPSAPVPVRDQWRTDAAWMRREVYPWAARHLRGRSSGDGRSAKRPELEPFTGPEPSWATSPRRSTSPSAAPWPTNEEHDA